MIADKFEIRGLEIVAQPTVSVLMITHNHGLYIAQAIESIVTQQCDFQFELIIGEDASTDDTRSIALAYQQRFPAIIRVIYSAANLGLMGNLRRILAAARGDYVAFCEGDDHWCSPYKIARQVGLIDGHPEIGMVHTDWVRETFDGEHWHFDARKSVHSKLPPELLDGDLFPIFYYPKILRTCTVLLRRVDALECFNSELGRENYKFGDNVRNAYMTAKARVAYLPEISAVYRESPNSALRSGARARVAFYRSSLEFDSAARIYFSGRSDYPQGYRWEAATSLLIWAARARDIQSVVFAMMDLWSHFGIVGALVAASRSARLRLGKLGRQMQSRS